MHPSLRTLIQSCDLDEEGVRAGLDQLIAQPEDPVSAAILTAWTCKGETGHELAAAAKYLLPRAIPLHIQGAFIDTCGTGGDGMETFNISTATAIVTASCGLRVVKHGNRAVSSRSGSADVLQCLGVRIDWSTEHLVDQLEAVGVIFCLAPNYHPTLAGLGPLRRKLGFKTLFNALGPLLNPARAPFQVIGVGQEKWLDSITVAASKLGNQRTCVVRGEDGLDEVTLSGKTQIRVVEGENIQELSVQPEDLGLPVVKTSALAAGSPEESAARILDLLSGRDESARMVVLANTGLALWTAGQAGTLRHGILQAEEAIDSGKSLETLNRWKNWSPGPKAG